MSKFIGYRHFEGTSKKTGNPYNFFECYFVKPLSSTERSAGFECMTVSMPRNLFEECEMIDHLNTDCDVYFNQFGRVESVLFR